MVAAGGADALDADLLAIGGIANRQRRRLPTGRIQAFGAMAPNTRKMRVALMRRTAFSDFKIRLPLLNVGLMDDIFFRQRHQRSVNGGFIGSGAAQPLADVRFAERTLRLDQDVQNIPPRLGGAQPSAF